MEGSKVKTKRGRVARSGRTWRRSRMSCRTEGMRLGWDLGGHGTGRQPCKRLETALKLSDSAVKETWSWLGPRDTQSIYSWVMNKGNLIFWAVRTCRSCSEQGLQDPAVLSKIKLFVPIPPHLPCLFTFIPVLIAIVIDGWSTCICNY